MSWIQIARDDIASEASRVNDPPSRLPAALVRTTMTAPLRRKRPLLMVQGYMQSGNPFDVATCMYYTGIDPFSGQEVFVARHLRDRRLQRALLQFFKPENYFEVREALIQAGRTDLIGGGCDCLIPAHAPPEALRARREQANE